MNEEWASRVEAADFYRPKRIRLLLVAEAPPEEKSRYFYFENVQEHDHLFEHVCEVLFENKPRHQNKPRYLEALRKRGVFLVDLKEDAPMIVPDHSKHVASLVKRCSENYKAESIILVKADVFDACFASLKESDLPVIEARIPFPSSGRQAEFRQGFRSALTAAGLDHLVRPLE